MSSMASINRNKLNHLFKDPPIEGILTMPWLKKHGISKKLAWWYVHSGWLARIHSGAYHFTGRPISLLNGVATLQNQLALSVHIGGKTALQLLGFAHYLPFELKQVVLFAPPTTKLPSWFNHVAQNDMTYTITATKLFNEIKTIDTLVRRAVEGVEMLLSCPERAIMEVLHQVLQSEQYEEAYLLMQNLTQVRPHVLQILLEHCNSIKVKRLFLYLAKLCGHTWLAQIEMAHISLGRGKRVIAEGGTYDPEYQLSVPILMDQGYNSQKLAE